MSDLVECDSLLLAKTWESLYLIKEFNPLLGRVTDLIPFAQDEVHTSYEPLFARRFWRILMETDRIFKRFRTGFSVSPVRYNSF